MTNPIEMEKRFQVKQADLNDFLENKKFISSKQVVDEYLDTQFLKDHIFQ